jgi:integrase
MRIGEALRLRWVDIDFQRRIIILNQTEKNDMPRMFQVSSELIGMLSKLPKNGEKIFNSSLGSASACFYSHRKRIAAKLDNPRLLRIGFHTLRHWKATMEYQRLRIFSTLKNF